MRRVNDDMLLAYATGELPPAEAAEVSEYLDRHPAAAAMVARFRASRAAAATDETVAAPPDVVRRAKEIFDPARLPRPATWFERLDQLVADLVFDSRLQPATVRLGPADEQVQLAWEAGGIEVDLQARRVAGDGGARWRVIGQVGAEAPPAGLRVAVRRGGDGPVVAETTTGEGCTFSVELADGRYDLLLERPDGVLVLENLRLE